VRLHFPEDTTVNDWEGAGKGWVYGLKVALHEKVKLRESVSPSLPSWLRAQFFFPPCVQELCELLPVLKDNLTPYRVITAAPNNGLPDFLHDGCPDRNKFVYDTVEDFAGKRCLRVNAIATNFAIAEYVRVELLGVTLNAF
jgi:hypothetical protein